jgi:hypothetical protein
VRRDRYHVATVEEIVRRWRANAAASGVRLTDDDVVRLTERGFIERVAATEAMLARLTAAEIAPDYLHTLSVQTTGGEHV